MIKILFVCHGNICRSPMAACVMKDFVQKAGLGEAIYINSAATSREELGNPIYPPARRTLQDHGIPMDGHREEDGVDLRYRFGEECSYGQHVIALY